LQAFEVWEHHVISCKMIEDVMYGMMPSAKIVMRRKLPPLKEIEDAQHGTRRLVNN